MERDVPARLTSAEGRKFGLTVGAAFLVLALILWWRDHVAVMRVVGALGGAFVAGGLLVPGRLGPVYRGWMAFGLALSKITTPIFMGIIYFLVLAPIGVLMRLLGKNPIAHEETAAGYWAVTEGRPKGDLKRQF